MNCTEFRESLRSGIELRRELSPEATLHAAMCADAECRSLGDDARLLEAAIVRWKMAMPVVDLADDVLRQLGGSGISVQPATVHPASRRESARTAWWSTACAVCAMVALTSLLLLRRGHDDLARQLAARAASQTASQDSSLSAGKIGRQYVAIAEGAGSLVADAVGAVLPGVSADAQKPPAQEWTSEWLRRLEPAQQRIDDVLMELQSMTDPAS
jgi:hypothetical protein